MHREQSVLLYKVTRGYTTERERGKETNMEMEMCRATLSTYTCVQLNKPVEPNESASEWE